MSDQTESISIDFSAYPADVRIVPLRAGTKDQPLALHGHLDAVPISQYVDLGQNAGIALDEQFILVDIDRPDCLEAKRIEKALDEFPTWSQRARRGRHWLYRTPPKFRGTNCKLRDANGTPYGDIKCLGYVVGPGSVVGPHTYAVTDARNPEPAPGWLMEAYDEARKHTAEASTEGRLTVPTGEQHGFLVALAGWLRGRQGLGEAAIEPVLRGALAILEQDATKRPWADTDLRRIAESVARYQADLSPELGPLLPRGWRAGAQFHSGRSERISWVLHGYVPRGCLTTMYGEGGIGKTTWAAWLAARETRARRRFGLIATEDDPDRFLAQVVGYGGDPDYLVRADRPLAYKLPESAPAIEQIIGLLELDTLFFDSLYDHISYKEGQNLAERARTGLGPLSDVAQRTKCAILGNLHQNKAGTYLGSVEVRNISRVMLAFKRRGHGPLEVDIEKSNYSNPAKTLIFTLRSAPFVNPYDGTVREEEQEDGTYAPATVGILEQGESVDAGAMDVEEALAEELKAKTTLKTNAERRENIRKKILG